MYKLERVGGRSTLAFAGAPIIADHSGAHVAGGFPDTFLEESPVPPAHPPGRMMSLDAKPTMDSLYSQDAQLAASPTRASFDHGRQRKEPAVRDGYWWKTIC